MSKQPEGMERRLFCGYCGERLPDLGEGQNGACPQCKSRFGLRREANRPPPPPIEVRYGPASRGERSLAGGLAFRDPVLAALLSAVIPGAGQVYNLQFFKGLFVFLTCWLIIPYFLGIFDAYLTAERTNRGWQTVSVKQ